VFGAGRAWGADRHWLGKETLKVLNPFQVPGTLNGNPQHHRRERFKKIFFTVLAVHVVLFLTPLIQGCRSERQASSQAQDSGMIASQR
jgi:hypothetical protein